MLKKTKEKVLSFDDRNRFASFFIVLLKVDKRVNEKKAKSKGNQKTKHKSKDIGPPIRGPFLFFNYLVFIYN